MSGDAVALTLADAGQVAAARRVVLRAARGHRLPSCRRPCGRGPQLGFRVPNGGAALPGLLRTLDVAGVALGGVEVHRPTLDDVFLSLTGRSLRDEPPTRLSRPRKASDDLLRDTYVVFARSLRLSLRNPTWVIIGLTQPILYLVLFGPLLKPMAAQLGGGNAWQIFVPGMLVQLGIFGGMFVGFGLIAEYRAGVIESSG